MRRSIHSSALTICIALFAIAGWTWNFRQGNESTTSEDDLLDPQRLMSFDRKDRKHLTPEYAGESDHQSEIRLSAIRQNRIKELIAKKNLSMEEMETLSDLLIQLGKTEPAIVCSMLSDGLGVGLFGHFKENIIGSLLSSHPPGVIAPLLVEMTSKVGINLESDETLNALARALAMHVDTISHTSFDDVIKKMMERSIDRGAVSMFFTSIARHNKDTTFERWEEYAGRLGIHGRELEKCRLDFAFAKVEHDPETIIPILKSMSIEQSGHVIGQAYATLFKTDPAKAMKFIASEDSQTLAVAMRDLSLLDVLATKENIEVTKDILSRVPLIDSMQWSLNHLMTTTQKSLGTSEALSLIESIPNSPSKSELIKNLYREAPVSNSKEAVDLLNLTRHASTDPQHAIEGLAARLTAMSIPEATKFVALIPPEYRSAIAPQIISRQLSADPEIASKMLLQGISDGYLNPEVQSRLTEGVGQSWGNVDPLQAVHWINTLSSTQQVPATSGLVQSWIKTDPEAASKWVTTLPDSPAKYEAAKVIANIANGNDPEMAELWGKYLDHTKNRTK